MKASRYSGSQIMAILKQAEAGLPTPELYRIHGKALGCLINSVMTQRIAAHDIVYLHSGVIMSNEPEIQRWTAKRKAELVKEIIKGKTNIAEAARTHGQPIG